MGTQVLFGLFSKLYVCTIFFFFTHAGISSENYLYLQKLNFKTPKEKQNIAKQQQQSLCFQGVTLYKI